MFRRLLVILMVTCIGASVLARPVSVRVSHAGSVRDLASDAQTQTLYSGGDDGTVRRWSVRPASLLAEYQVSHNPVTQVAVHPQRPLFAALATDGRRSHILHIWDVERGQEVGRRYLDEEPLFVRYSPTGSYLVYATADFRSVHVLDGNRGRPLPYLRSPLGLVNYLLFSSSETTVVAYAPGSGTFNYLNLRTGEEARTVKSLRDLQYLSVLSDRKRNAVAKSGDLLVVVDIYTGEEKDSRFLPGIQSITVDPASGTIAVVSRVEDRIDFSTWQFRDGALARRFLTLRDLDVDLTKLAYHEGQIVSGHADGSIYQYSRYGGSRRLVADYPLAKIHDFEVTEGRMHLSLPEEILTITSDLFTRSPQDRIGYVFTRRADNPFSAEVGLEPLHTGEVIAWTDDGRQAAFTFLDTQDEVFDEFETPLLKLRGFPGTILALERSGALKRIDPASLQVEFEFSAVGIQTMVETDAYGIVAGKNAAGIIDTALIRIDPRTGETVGVPTDPFFVYDLQVGEGPRELFSIGLERRAGSTNTVVSRHSGRNLERTNTIMLYPGEDLRAGLYVDPETYDVYTTAGYEGVKIWDGRRIRQFEAPGSIPRAVRSFGSYVFAINRDATLTVWDKRSGEYLLRFYVFADGEWIAVTSEGYYAQSENADAQSYLALTDEAARGRTLEDYRISPPFVLP